MSFAGELVKLKKDSTISGQLLLRRSYPLEKSQSGTMKAPRAAREWMKGVRVKMCRRSRGCRYEAMVQVSSAS